MRGGISLKPHPWYVVAIVALASSCTIKINPLDSTKSPFSSSGLLSVAVPSAGQSVHAYQKFSGHCDPSVPLIRLTYSSDSTGGAWGPSSASCGTDGRFQIGVNLYGANHQYRAVTFAQEGFAPVTREVYYEPSGMNGAPSGVDGPVRALLRDSSSGKLYVGGAFSSYGSLPIKGLLRLHADGTLDTSFVPPGGGFDGWVNALALDSSTGKLYIGGTFTTYAYSGETTTQNRLTRLNADGTVDTSFVPSAGGFNDVVHALVWDSVGGKLFVGGAFTSYTREGTTTQNGLTRLNADGTADTTFVPAGGGFNSVVHALVWDSVGGKLFVGGQFTSYNRGGATAQNRLAKLNADGAVDTGFVSAGSGFGNTVLALAWDAASGKLYAGGSFTSYTKGVSTAQNRLTRLNADGTVDTAFLLAGEGFDSIVYALAWDSDSGKLYAGGWFSSYTKGTATAQSRLTRLNSDGTVDTAFVPASGGFLPAGGGYDAEVVFLAWDAPSGKLYAGGNLGPYAQAGTRVQRYLARLDANGVLDHSFMSSSDRWDGFVETLVPDPVSGKLYVGGWFTQYFSSGAAVQNRLTRLNADGTLDSSFVPAGGGFDGYVKSIALDSASGKIYVAGGFTSYTNGSTTTQNYLTRLNSNGTVDTTFVPAGGGFDDAVWALALDPVSGKLYVGGDFSSYTNGSTTTQNYLTRLNPDGTVDTTFVSAGGGLDYTPYALAVDAASGKLYVGGDFSAYTKGGTTAQYFLTRLNPDGTVDTSFLPAGEGLDSSVRSLVLDPHSGKLYVGGDFSVFSNGSATTQNYLTRLNPDGTVDTSFVPAGGGFDDTVTTLALDSSSGKLYVGGFFASYSNGSSIAQKHLTRLDADGTVDTSFVPEGGGTSRHLSALVFDPAVERVYFEAGGRASYMGVSTGSGVLALQVDGSLAR